MTYLAASPQLLQMSVDLLNNQITPVVRERGGTGQAQGPASSNIQAALVGAGEVYYKGTRMPAADALKKAGLKPIKPHPSDSALGATNSDTAGMAALMAITVVVILMLAARIFRAGVVDQASFASWRARKNRG